ncbi:hypothetical protein [Virgibacillus sediminis]|uniref:Uncharacterized protein n=1 Tax=Virgibacillus sediminis TaxID=202260 RepID=A0ABV7A2X8_9BACI
MGCCNKHRRHHEDDSHKDRRDVRGVEGRLDNLLAQLQRQAQLQEQDQEQDQDQRQRQADFDFTSYENIGNPENNIVVNNEDSVPASLAAIIAALSLAGGDSDLIQELIDLLEELLGSA